jgi:hypothetical protein
MIFSILLGGLTHHYVLPEGNYCGQVNNYGSIVNPYVISMVGSEKLKTGMILGKDSSCSNIFGSVSSVNLYKNIDLMVGAYNTNTREFNNRGLQPIEYYGMTPILGIDYRIKLYKNITLDTLVSLGIVTHALRVDF